jgi:hypothetical protein
MRTVCLLPISMLFSSGCDTKAEHGFVAGGGEAGSGGGSVFLEAWGDCAEESGVELDSDAVVQVVPPPGARNVSLHTPMVVFLEEGFDLDDVDRFEVFVDGEEVEGDVVEMVHGSTVAIGFAPLDAYGSAVEVSATLEVPGGEVSWQFNTGPYESTMAGDPNLSFEKHVTNQGIECEYTYFTDNFIGFGDVAITDETAGPTEPTDGSNRLLMSTGEVLGNASIRGTTSFVTSQLLPAVDEPNLRFDYRFLSEEFDEHVGAVHDDRFLIFAHGKAGMVLEEVTSVNQIGVDGSTDAPFPGLVNSEASEWSTHTMTGFNTLGADATVTLIVTDVGESDRTSAVSVDHLRVE